MCRCDASHEVVIFMPDWMSRERKDLIASFGARIVNVSHEEGGFLGSIARARDLAAAHARDVLDHGGPERGALGARAGAAGGPGGQEKFETKTGELHGRQGTVVGSRIVGGVATVVVFVLGTILMRSAGCCINDVADRDFDRHVKRTAQRPVTSGNSNRTGLTRSGREAGLPGGAGSRPR